MNARPAPFVLISTEHGNMIVNRNDFNRTPEGTYGVGCQLMTKSCYEPDEIAVICKILKLQKQYFGDGVVAIDCGANIGVHTIEWAKLMTGWGEVIAFEAQEKVYYSLAGNIMLNNCLNVTAKHQAIGEKQGTLEFTVPDYTKPASYGSLELQQHGKSEFIGQQLSASDTKETVEVVTVDSIDLSRLDVLKIDIEGMEEAALNGAKNTISSCRPVLFVEYIKSDKNRLLSIMEELNYKTWIAGMNIIAVPEESNLIKHFEQSGNQLSII